MVTGVGGISEGASRSGSAECLPAAQPLQFGERSEHGHSQEVSPSRLEVSTGT